MNKSKRILTFILALITVMMCFVSCGQSASVMEFQKYKVTGNMYKYWMSRYKALFLYTYAGSEDSKTFWDTEIADGVTAEKLFTNIVDENIKKNIICMYLFDKYNLTLTASAEEAIDADIEQLINDIGEGSKKQFNAYAADFGVNEKILKQIYIIEEKIELLRDYLYGQNGVEKITDAQKNDYYKENYVHIKHIFFSTTDKYILDKDGHYQYDAAGNVITEKLTDEEKQRQTVKADAVLARIKEGESFETLLNEYSEDESSKTYTNGFYLSASTDYIDEVTSAAFDMEENEIRLVTSAYGVHIIKKYALDDNAYAKTENKDFFEDFEENVISEVFQKKIMEYINEVKVNTKEKDKYSIVDIPANLTF